MRKFVRYGLPAGEIHVGVEKSMFHGPRVDYVEFEGAPDADFHDTALETLPEFVKECKPASPKVYGLVCRERKLKTYKAFFGVRTSLGAKKFKALPGQLCDEMYVRGVVDVLDFKAGRGRPLQKYCSLIPLIVNGYQKTMLFSRATQVSSGEWVVDFNLFSDYAYAGLKWKEFGAVNALARKYAGVDIEAYETQAFEEFKARQ